jgi:isopenicillin N synthase-like dioxygenase
VVPVIKLSSEPKLLIDAFRTIGFAYLEDHGVSTDLQSRLIKSAETFFAQPLDTKMKYAMKNSGKAWRGYFPVGGELTSGKPDLKEGFYFGIDHPPQHPNLNRPTFGQNPWPDAALKAAVTEYMREMKRVSTALLEMVAEGLSLERDFFRKAFSAEPTEFFRIFAYPMHTTKDDDWGVREHTDMGFLTVLKQDDSGGLQAKHIDGHWVDVPPRPNALVLNIGDMLEFWTGGVLRSTPHRVRNPARQNRFSYPYFFDPNWNSSLEPIDPKRLAQFPKSVTKRWDGLELHALKSTYGEFVWNKISKVFPDLA